MSRAANLNDLASDPNLANNPFFQGLHAANQANANRKNSKKKNKNKNVCRVADNQWIVDLLKEEKAKSQQKHGFNIYSKAITNLKKYPFQITNESDALEVDGIGPKIARMIKQGLVRRDNYLPENPVQCRQNAREQIAKQMKSKNSKPIKKTKKRKRPYVPAKRSGGYALLIQLYKSTKEYNISIVSKQDLIRDAQQYADHSFTEPNRNGYTAWGSITTLEREEYVQRINRGKHFFSLTEKGRDIASRLYAEMTQSIMPPKPDKSLFYGDLNDQGREEKKYKFQCPHCSKQYQLEKAFNKHLSNKHGGGQKLNILSCLHWGLQIMHMHTKQAEK